jgi:hypothetical protein
MAATRGALADLRARHQPASTPGSSVASSSTESPSTTQAPATTGLPSSSSSDNLDISANGNGWRLKKIKVTHTITMIIS